MYTSKHSCRRETARSSILYWKCLYNVMRQVYTPCIYFCRAMLCMRGLCRHAVSVSLSIRPSVCLSVTFVYFNKHTPIFKIYLPSGSHTILVFPWHSGGNAPPMDASNAGGVGKNRDSEPICLHRVLSTLRPGGCYQHGAAGPWQVVIL